MLFSSISFLYFFLPIILLLYGAATYLHKGQNLVLLAASLVFYAWGEPIYVLLMLVQITLTYIFSRIMNTKQGILNKIVYSLAIFIPLLSLGIFKYAGIPNLALPIGISFYTFQLVSFVADVHRGEVKPPKRWSDFAAYVTFFPQLIAGPIVRYSDVEADLLCVRAEKVRISDSEEMTQGVLRFLTGMAKKVLIANVLGEFVEQASLSELGQRTIALSWAYAAAVALQLYFDFSGYSDMAIGLGKLFGFHFPENFRYPFISKSMTEFWRRWHITLGSWFRDYVYIPLGGNRVPMYRWIINIAIVWALTGIWHGAGLNFLLWGLFFGVLLVLEKLFANIFNLNAQSKSDQKSTLLCNICRHIYVIVGIMISFLIFHGENMHIIGADIVSLWKVNGTANEACDYLLRNIVGILAISCIGATPIPAMLINALCRRLKGKWQLTLLQGITALVLLLLCTAYLIDGSFNPFLYFRF